MSCVPVPTINLSHFTPTSPHLPLNLYLLMITHSATRSVNLCIGHLPPRPASRDACRPRPHASCSSQSGTCPRSFCDKPGCQSSSPSSFSARTFGSRCSQPAKSYESWGVERKFTMCVMKWQSYYSPVQ